MAQDLIVMVDKGGETSSRGATRKVLGRSLETKLLDDVFLDLTIKKSSPPPLVPLCRLMTNEVIHMASATLDGLKTSTLFCLYDGQV